MNITANHVMREDSIPKNEDKYEQMSLFTDYRALEKERMKESEKLSKERRIQEAELSIKKRFGKNAILRGMNFEEGATAKDRNAQIGGHRA